MRADGSLRDFVFFMIGLNTLVILIATYNGIKMKLRKREQKKRMDKLYVEMKEMYGRMNEQRQTVKIDTIKQFKEQEISPNMQILVSVKTKNINYQVVEP